MLLPVHFSVILVFVQCFLFGTVATNATAATNLSDNSQAASCGMEINHMSKTEQQQFTKLAWRRRLKSNAYDNGLPPNYPDETKVGITVFPAEISRVDEFGQTIKHKLVMKLMWTDLRLAFQHQNVCEFPYKKELLVSMHTDHEVFADQQEIWIPKIYLKHRHIESGATFLLRILTLLVFPDGTVFMDAFFDEVRNCDIRVARFPFDVQMCPLALTTMHNVRLRHTEEQNEMLIAAMEFGVKAMPEWLETNEWMMFTNKEQIIDSLTKPKLLPSNDNTSTIVYNVYLTRKHEQHVVNWVASPIVLSVSCVIGMYRGCNVGERFSFGGTIVVAITLMVNEIRNVLGVGGDGYPILGQLYLGLEMTLILATLMSGLPQRWHNKAISVHGSSKTANKPVQRSTAIIEVRSRIDMVWKRSETSKQKINAISGWIGEQKHCLAVMRGQWDNDAYDVLVMGFILLLQAVVVIYVTIRWIV